MAQNPKTAVEILWAYPGVPTPGNQQNIHIIRLKYYGRIREYPLLGNQQQTQIPQIKLLYDLHSCATTGETKVFNNTFR